MRTLSVDLSRFTRRGFGSVHGSTMNDLRPGERIAVTDSEADTLEAEVISVSRDTAAIRIFWDHIRMTD